MRTNKAVERWSRELLHEVGVEERPELVERAVAVRGWQGLGAVLVLLLPVTTLLYEAAVASWADEPFDELRAGSLYLRLTVHVFGGCVFLLLVHRGDGRSPATNDASPPAWTWWLPLGGCAPFLAAPTLLFVGVDGGGPLFLIAGATGLGLFLYLVLRQLLLCRPLSDDGPTARFEVALRSTTVCVSAGIMTGFALVQLAGLTTYLETGEGVSPLDVLAGVLALAALTAGLVVMRLPLRSVLPAGREPAQEPLA